jgi:transmembrane sensor
MGQERIWTLLSRKLANEAIDAELAELDILLKEHPELIAATQQITESWKQEITTDAEFMEATYLVHLERMKDRGYNLSGTENETVTSILPVKKNKTRKRAIYFIGGCALACLVFAFIYQGSVLKNVFAKNLANTSNKKEIITLNGTKTKTQLPDGSTVWLNAGSKVTYSGNLSGPTREVYLEGEAYFDVVKQPLHPFIVHTGNINIRVLGTAFNVKSYSTDKTIETTLLRGLIKITKQDDTSKAVYLHPNQKITIERNNSAGLSGTMNAAIPVSAYPISTVDVSSVKEIQETAWMFNRLSFNGDDFETMAEKLERWYDVKIVFEDDAVKKIHFKGSLENETIQEALKALQLATPFNYKIINNEIHISSISLQ